MEAWVRQYGFVNFIAIKRDSRTYGTVKMKTADRDVPVCLVRDMIEEQAGVVWSQILHQQFYEDIEQHRRNRTGLGVTSGIRQNDTAADFFGAGRADLR